MTPLVGGDIERFDTYLRDAKAEAAAHLSAEQIERLVYNYGTAWRAVVTQASDGAPLRPLGAHCPVTAAEVLYAVREEMALTLGDVLLRRTEAGSRGHPGDDAVEAALRVLAGELGWSDARQSQERQDLRRVYETTTLAGN